MSRGAVVGLVALALAACSDPPRPRSPTPPDEPAGDDAASGQGTGLEPDHDGLPEVPEDERIAAIEHAMNELAPIANQCWAAAAADDFHLAGDVRALISVGAKAGPGAAVTITGNTTDDDVLGRCLVTVLGAYPWGPQLAGQAVELPFHFSAPSMQNVIDRRLVPRHQQGGVTLAVLLDETNTGNPGLSLFELEATAATTVPAREIERAEVWFVLRGGATLKSAGAADQKLLANDVVILPKGARVEVVAPAAEPLAAVIAVVPGGREGSARAGALPGKGTTMAVRARPPQPVLRHAADARHFVRAGGGNWFFVEPPAAGGALSLGVLDIDPGVTVPAHVHAKETEALYLLAGGGTMTVAGVPVPVTATSVVQVPPGVEHGFVSDGAGPTRALQIYSPAGPEQRFKKPPAKAVSGGAL